MKINIKDYLSQDEIKEIIKEEIVDSIRNSNDKERIFYNATAKYLETEMNKTEGDKLSKLLKEKAKKAIKEKDLSYELFKKPDTWDRTEGYCYKILQKTCDENKDILKLKVIELFNSIDKEHIVDKLQEVIREIFKNKL